MVLVLFCCSALEEKQMLRVIGTDGCITSSGKSKTPRTKLGEKQDPKNKAYLPDGCIILSGERQDPKNMKPAFLNNETVIFYQADIILVRPLAYE